MLFIVVRIARGKTRQSRGTKKYKRGTRVQGGTRIYNASK